MKEAKVLMLGLDATGKSTILNQMNPKKTSETPLPTIGFNLEHFLFKNVEVSVWEVGGQIQFRPLWRHCAGAQAIVFVVDSSDRASMDEAKMEFLRVLNDEAFVASVVLVFANKQDEPGAMTPDEIQEKFELTKIRERNWFVQPSCAKTGEGLIEGFTWLTENDELNLIRNFFKVNHLEAPELLETRMEFHAAQWDDPRFWLE